MTKRVVRPQTPAENRKLMSGCCHTGIRVRGIGVGRYFECKGCARPCDGVPAGDPEQAFKRWRLPYADSGYAHLNDWTHSTELQKDAWDAAIRWFRRKGKRG
jgi:hypothetical protein